MALYTDSLVKIIAFGALICVSSSTHANAGPEQASVMTVSQDELGDQTSGTSLLPTEAKVTRKHHKTEVSAMQSGLQHKARDRNAKSKDGFLSIASSAEEGPDNNRALPSSFLAASSSSSAAASSYASLMSDRSLEPLESLELESTLEGLRQHEYNEGEDDSEPGVYHIAPEDAPRFPGSVLETDSESDGKEEVEEQEEAEEEEPESDQEDYQGLGLSASESRSVRDAFHPHGVGAQKTHDRKASRTEDGDDLSSSLQEDLDLALPQKPRRKTPKRDEDDLDLALPQKPRRKVPKRDEDDSLSSSLQEDLDLALPQKPRRHAPNSDGDDSLSSSLQKDLDFLPQKPRRQAHKSDEGSDEGDPLSSSLQGDLDLSVQRNTYPHVKAPNSDEDDSHSSSLLEDLDLSHPQKPRIQAHKGSSLSSSLLQDLQLSQDDGLDDDEEVGNGSRQDTVSKTDEEDEELLRKDSAASLADDDITEEATQSLKNLRKALEGGVYH